MAADARSPRDWIRAADRADGAWAAAVRTLPPEARREVLAAADACFAAEDRARAADVYETLAADLDPAVPEGVARIRRLVAERRAVAPDLEDLFTRTAASSADPTLGAEALAILVQRALARGDRDCAERAFVGLIDRVRGRADRIEGVAYVNYARFCLSSGREFEALASARRAEALFRSLHDSWGFVLAVMHRGRVAQDLRDWTRVDESIAQIEAMVPLLPAREAALVRISLHDRRAHAAWARGRTDEALLHADEADALERRGSAESPSLTDPRTSALLRVLALVAGKRLDEAVSTADRALAYGARHEPSSMFLRTARLEARVASGASDVEAEASSILDDCRDHEAGLSPGRRREFATGVARALVGVPSALPTMRRAFDVAAAAAFERAAEVDRFVHTLPEASELLPEDAEMLESHRRSTLAEQAALGAAVARALERAAEEGRSPLPMFGDAGGLIRVCAWCQRVRTNDGAWLSVQQFLPLRSAVPMRVTHGICDRCSAALLARAGSRRR